jgi:hypothetical protein
LLQAENLTRVALSISDSEEVALVRLTLGTMRIAAALADRRQ